MIQRYTFFIFGILFFFASCKKDKVANTQNSFDIYSVFVDSNRIISSIDTIKYHPSGCGLIPFPSDSLDTDSLDLDNDLEYDLFATAKSWYNFVSASSPCVNYCHSIILSSTNDKIQFVKKGNYNQVALINKDIIIDSTNSWSNSISLSLYVPSAPFSCNYDGEHYIGFRLVKETGCQYGWLKIKSKNYGINIMEGCYNKTNNMGIPAGKKEN